jgi:tetratricopeptide (TPR) repeat protein
MRAHPRRVLELVGRKTAYFWGPAEPADNKVVAGDRANSGVLSAIPMNFAFVFALAIAGCALFAARGGRRRSDHEAERETARACRSLATEGVVLLLALTIAWYASHLPFAVTARYRVPTIPFLAVLGGYYVDRMWVFARGRSLRNVGIWAAVLVGALVFANIEFVTDSEPTAARWHYQRGIALMRAGRLRESAGELQEALRINPDYTAVHNDLAAVLANQGLIAQSIPHFRRAIERNPRDPTMRFNLALALELTGQLEESAAEYRASLAIHPGDAEARAGLERVQGMIEEGAGQ